MKYLQNSLLFILLLSLNIVLITLFSLHLYIIYFISLTIFIYILSTKFKEYPLKPFLLHVAVILIVINLNIYEELFFEILLYFDLLGKLFYTDSEIMYALSAIHILLFINLKRFGNIWAIIGKNYLG